MMRLHVHLLIVTSLWLGMCGAEEDASAVHALPDGSQEYTISIKSPNLTLVNVSAHLLLSNP